MLDKKVKSIVLAAGKGTRMKSELPKVLHTIFNKPLLSYVIDAVNNTGYIDENFVIVGHEAEKVENFVSSSFANAKCILQAPQLGTGDAVNKATPFLKDFDGYVVVVCGDTPLITAETLKNFIDFHDNNHADLTVMSAIFDNPKNYGRIVRDKNNKFVAIVEEKDATSEQKAVKEVNAGIYCINWKTVSESFNNLKNNNAQGEYYLTDIVKWAVEKHLVVQSYILENNEEIFGINSKIQLSEATKILNKKSVIRLMEEGVQIVDPDTTFISPETTIGADTLVLPNVYITGKNTIGKNCKIGPFAHIRDGATIGNNVRIGNFVEVKKSVIKDNTNVSHLSYIGDAELGSKVNIGAGTITANYNPITKVKSKTIIKDGANTGSNSVIVAPVTIEEMASVAAGSVITKDVEAYSLAITRSPLKVFSNWVKNKIEQYSGGNK
ncbi:MAG: bifunctional N-acetylglucosamine-1-phosphate uridyltransferase/glucosamine-1-phosphate acetyltransferase [Cyanobacteria bacterium SIG29]|nr:bifunctional N-acetylglucosamine-1-phosphate uridyltransferase/glucosamine-1-phosphate acetyltransferase [Cyanobacteria bacterium SIG29]